MQYEKRNVPLSRSMVVQIRPTTFFMQTSVMCAAWYTEFNISNGKFKTNLHAYVKSIIINCD